MNDRDVREARDQVLDGQIVIASSKSFIPPNCAKRVVMALARLMNDRDGRELEEQVLDDEM